MCVVYNETWMPEWILSSGFLIEEIVHVLSLKISFWR